MRVQSARAGVRTAGRVSGATSLADRVWRLIVDGRDPDVLAASARGLSARSPTDALPGDVVDPQHGADLATAVRAAGRLDLLVNNAGTLGPSPLPGLASVDERTLAHVYRVNAIAPLTVFQAVRPALEAAAGVVINITSDATRGPSPGWGVYGSSKAALEQRGEAGSDETHDRPTTAQPVTERQGGSGRCRPEAGSAFGRTSL